MSIMNSLLVAFTVMGIVFTVLAALCALLKLQAKLFNTVSFTEEGAEKNMQIAADIESRRMSAGIEISSGELELIGVEESDAAMIMAITSDALKIPLNELQFKSIKALDK